MSNDQGIRGQLYEAFNSVSSSIGSHCQSYLITPLNTKYRAINSKHPGIIHYLPIFISAAAIASFPQKKVFFGGSLLLAVNIIKPALITDELIKKVILGGAIVVGTKTILASLEAFAKFVFCGALVYISIQYPDLKKKHLRGFFVVR